MGTRWSFRIGNNFLSCLIRWILPQIYFWGWIQGQSREENMEIPGMLQLFNEHIKKTNLARLVTSLILCLNTNEN